MRPKGQHYHFKSFFNDRANLCDHMFTISAKNWPKKFLRSTFFLWRNFAKSDTFKPVNDFLQITSIISCCIGIYKFPIIRVIPKFLLNQN